MDIEIVPLLMTVGGAVLLYGAIKNRNPIDVVKSALSGKSIADAKPLNGGVPGGGDGGDNIADEVSTGSPSVNVDSLGVANGVQGVLKYLGVDGNYVVIPYRGHPIGSHAGDPDVPGYLGGVAGKNSSYPKNDPRYNVPAGTAIPPVYEFNAGAPGLGGTP